jgi:hypothetical protein
MRTSKRTSRNTQAYPAQVAEGPPTPTTRVETKEQAELNTHIAEYDALTMRNTYWITLQYAIYALAGGYLGFAVQARNSIPNSRLIWVSILVLLLLAWAMLQTQYEMFANVIYLEHHLKPRVQALLGTTQCWAYEDFKAHQRASGFAHFEWRYGLLGAFIVGLGVAVWLIFQTVKKAAWTAEDTAWAVANIYLAILVAGKLVQSMRLGTQLGDPKAQDDSGAGSAAKAKVASGSQGSRP